MNNGYFKFNIDKEMPTRYLDGKYSFLVQVKLRKYVNYIYFNLIYPIKKHFLSQTHKDSASDQQNLKSHV